MDTPILPQPFRKRLEYLPYMALASVAMLAIFVALTLLVVGGWVPMVLGRRILLVTWLVLSGLGVISYARSR